MGDKGQDIVCNSGLTEQGYRFAGPCPKSRTRAVARGVPVIHWDFIDNFGESSLLLNTKIDGFVAMTHLWAREAIYHKQPLQFIYISSLQAIEPGVAVPRYAVANWAVLKLGPQS